MYADIMEHVCRDMGQLGQKCRMCQWAERQQVQQHDCKHCIIVHFFLHIGAVTVLRSKTNLIEALTNYP